MAMLLSIRRLVNNCWLKTALIAVMPIAVYPVIAEPLSCQPQILRQDQRRPSSRGGDWSPLLAFSPDSTLLATLDDGIEVWDVTTGKLIWTPEKQTRAEGPLIFSPDGKLLASGGDRAVKLWNSHSGKIEQTLAHTESGYSRLIPMAFSPDGRTLACVHATRTVELWDVTTGQLLHRLSGHISSVEEAVFAPDGKTMASGADDGTVIWWDTRSGKLLRTLKARPEWVGIIVFSPDAGIMATGRDFGIKIWDLQTGELLRTLTGNGEKGYYPGTFSADGKSLISIGAWPLFDAPTLTSRNVQTGSLTRLCALQLYQDHTFALAPDGSTLATGEATGAIKLWRVK